MHLKPLFSAVAMIAALASGHASALDLQSPLGEHVQIEINPDRWEQVASVPSGIRGKGCTFYEHANGEGEQWHKEVSWLAQRYDNQDSYSQYVTTVGEWWNDRISSIQCDEGDDFKCMVAVYRDVDRGGGDSIFWSSQGLFDLDEWGWDDTISSYQIFCNLMK